jgi:hypothetical protein
MEEDQQRLKYLEEPSKGVKVYGLRSTLHYEKYSFIQYIRDKTIPDKG